MTFQNPRAHLPPDTVPESGDPRTLLCGCGRRGAERGLRTGPLISLVTAAPAPSGSAGPGLQRSAPKNPEDPRRITEAT